MSTRELNVDHVVRAVGHMPLLSHAPQDDQIYMLGGRDDSAQDIYVQQHNPLV